MPRVVWVVVGVLVVALVAGVLWLDYRQAQEGASSLFALPWGRAALPRDAAPPRASRPPAGLGAPRIAVVIDELGARADVFRDVVALGRPLTVAVLPDLPLSRRIAQEAPGAGLEALLQLPLEPYRYPELDPGPGALLTSMSPAEIAGRTRRHLASVPGTVGVVTRMGSRFTEDGPRMQALLEAVRGEGRFFVDSRTTQASVGYDLARALGLPAARGQVLLEPDDDEPGLRARLDAAERWAARRGSVVVIGHGRLLTVRLLAEALPRWEQRGFRLVRVSELLRGRAAAAPAGARGRS